MKALNKKTMERLSPELMGKTLLYMSEFTTQDEQTASDILWRLTYDPTGFCKEKFGYEDPITHEQGRSIRLELAEAYKQEHPAAKLYQEVNLPEEMKKVAESATENDLYAQPRMLEKLRVYAEYYDGQSCDRVLWLLKSNKEAHNFGGLREVGFSYEEATFFKLQTQLWAKVFEYLAKDKIREYAEKKAVEKRKAAEEAKKRQKQLEERKKAVEPYLEFKKRFEIKVGIPADTILQNRGDIVKLLKLYDEAYGS